MKKQTSKTKKQQPKTAKRKINKNYNSTETVNKNMNIQQLNHKVNFKNIDVILFLVKTLSP